MTLNFYRSCDVKQPVSVTICNLTGGHDAKEKEPLSDDQLFFTSNISGLSDLYVEFSISANRMQMCPPIQTSHKIFNGIYAWNETIELPVFYHNLSRDCKLDFSVWDIHGPAKRTCLGKGSIDLFDDCGALKFGKHFIPMAKPANTGHVSLPAKLKKLQRDIYRYNTSEVAHVEWLDELINLRLLQQLEEAMADAPLMILTIDLPSFGCDMIYTELSHSLPPDKSEVDNIDPEVLYPDNILEAKHHLQMRSQRRGILDKHIKPSMATRVKLDEIVSRSPTQPVTPDEHDLLWHHRYYLSKSEDALPYVMASVNWGEPLEAKQAQELLGEWAPIGTSVALRLLSKDFLHAAIREFAVKSLRSAEYEDLELILLQLVQALKYEVQSHKFMQAIALSQSQQGQQPLAEASSSSHDTLFDSHDASRGRTASVAPKLAVAAPSMIAMSLPSSDNSVMITSGVDAERKRAGHSRNTSITSISSTALGEESKDVQTRTHRGSKRVKSVLREFLFEIAMTNVSFAQMFYWYLHVEERDVEGDAHEDMCAMYGRTREELIQRLQQTAEGKHIAETVHRSHMFMDQLCDLSNEIKKSNLSRPRKIKKLQELLSKDDEYSSINCPLPMDPNIIVTGIDAPSAQVFKSAMQPLGLTLHTQSGRDFGIIFKNGDDLRQDQLVLQVITLMDRLLKKENLDMKLTPYRCLAGTKDYGMVECVNAIGLSKLNGIGNYLKEKNPDPAAPLGIKKEVMDNYVRSLSGYCVITYLLAVGDRHLDNLMLTEDGHLFHIDFGFILGRDPKPYPPPMKLTKDMVEAMGGANGELVKLFRSHCFNCYLILRKRAKLILNLFGLMVDSNVEDIALDRDKTLSKVEDRFRLDMDDESAVKFFQELLDSSLAALFPRLVEGIHSLAQFMRK